MKLVKLIVRGTINGIIEDNGLRALDEYYESPTIKFADGVSECQMTRKLRNLFQEDYKHILQPRFKLDILN